jgi:hypothetical protein
MERQSPEFFLLQSRWVQAFTPTVHPTATDQRFDLRNLSLLSSTEIDDSHSAFLNLIAQDLVR